MNVEVPMPGLQAKIAKTLFERIRSGVFSLKNTDAASVLEFLYIAYTDIQGRDPKDIEEGFVVLDNRLEGVSLEVNNEIFTIVCGLCNAYEKRAFIDAVQIGAALALELQGN